ncbi:unnamed protein product, partial [marine sediment metagenome]
MSKIKNPTNSRNILITGGAGFIGANLVKYFLDKEGYDITLFDNLSAETESNLNRAIRDSEQKSKINFIKGDILDYSSLNKAIKGHSEAIHLAAHTRVTKSLKNPKENFEVNSIGAFNVIEVARKNRIKKFIFASSNATAGEQIPPI